MGCDSEHRVAASPVFPFPFDRSVDSVRPRDNSLDFRSSFADSRVDESSVHCSGSGSGSHVRSLIQCFTPHKLGDLGRDRSVDEDEGSPGLAQPRNDSEPASLCSEPSDPQLAGPRVMDDDATTVARSSVAHSSATPEASFVIDDDASTAFVSKLSISQSGLFGSRKESDDPDDGDLRGIQFRGASNKDAKATPTDTHAEGPEDREDPILAVRSVTSEDLEEEVEEEKKEEEEEELGWTTTSSVSAGAKDHVDLVEPRAFVSVTKEWSGLAETHSEVSGAAEMSEFMHLEIAETRSEASEAEEESECMHPETRSGASNEAEELAFAHLRTHSVASEVQTESTPMEASVTMTGVQNCSGLAQVLPIVSDVQESSCKDTWPLVSEEQEESSPAEARGDDGHSLLSDACLAPRFLAEQACDAVTPEPHGAGTECPQRLTVAETWSDEPETDAESEAESSSWSSPPMEPRSPEPSNTGQIDRAATSPRCRTCPSLPRVEHLLAGLQKEHLKLKQEYREEKRRKQRLAKQLSCESQATAALQEQYALEGEAFAELEKKALYDAECRDVLERDLQAAKQAHEALTRQGAEKPWRPGLARAGAVAAVTVAFFAVLIGYSAAQDEGWYLA